VPARSLLRRNLWLLVATTGLALGCALPDYHLPSGFSSTYYRHLQQSQTMPTETVIETRPAPVWSWRHWTN